MKVVELVSAELIAMGKSPCNPDALHYWTTGVSETQQTSKESEKDVIGDYNLGTRNR
jgi:hypothetical protein